MSTNTSLQLPLTGKLSVEEKERAVSVIAEAIKQKHDDIDSVLSEHLYNLLNEQERGHSSFEYGIFIQNLLLMMLKPENASELYKIHGDRAAKYFDSLLNFFERLGHDNNLSSWQYLQKVTTWYYYMNDKEVYDLWREYVNPDQNVIE